MRRTLTKHLLMVAVGAMALLAQGCKRTPPPTPAAAPRTAPAPRVDSFPSDDAGAVGAPTSPLPQNRHRRRVDVPQTAPTPVVNQPTDAELEAQQKERDQGLLLQQQAASQRQQQELNRLVEQSQKATEEEQGEPRIQEAPGPEPAPRIQDAPGPAPAPRIQDAPGPTPGRRIQDDPGPSQTLPPVQPQPTPPQV